MKISPPQINSFKGHAAGKIKALYMQNPESQRQVNIYNEMREIGKQEGFDVFMHTGKTFESERILRPSANYGYWRVWSQDNKIITKENDETILLTSKLQDKEAFTEAQLFCHNKGIKGYSTQLHFDGGDVFLGKRDNGERFLLTSRQTIYLNAIYQYIKAKNPEYVNYDSFLELINDGVIFDEKGNIIADIKECSIASLELESQVHEMFCDTFEVEPENLIILPEPEFHLDLAIRPLNYPYILVNDDKEVDKTISEIEEEFENDLYKNISMDRIKARIKSQRKEYSSSDEVCETLEKNGFIPIRIAMMYGRGEINFANAIVQQNGKELTYITNSTETEASFYNAFQEHFKKDLLEKCPQIKKIYFVSGDKIGKDLNEMMIYLGHYKGGIHCLCCEEMEE